MSNLAAEVVAWVRADIEARGGTGRRLGKIETALSDGSDEWHLRFAAALREILDSGRATLDEPLPGFVYLVPRDG